MEHLTLPSVGASFKKWRCCTPILPKALAHSSKLPQKNKFKNKKNSKKKGQSGLSRYRPMAGGRLRVDTWIGQIASFFLNFFSPILHFLRKWSTPSHWLQHMPALTRPSPKTTNTHNFWSVGPKIMKFVLTGSLLRDASSQKVSKI
jgi:hypothetical protein